MKLLRFLLVVGAIAGAALSARPSYAEGDDQTPPVCGIEEFSPYSTFFPKDDGYRDTVFMDYAVSDDFAGDIRVQRWIIVPDGSGTIIDTGAEVLAANPGSGHTSWDGRDSGGALVPEGDYLYTLQVTDAAGNISNECQQPVTVDHAKLTRKTFSKTVEPARTVLDGGRLVGDCSSLRNPVRHWPGSLGYYSNTKCEKPVVGDEDPSIVITINGILVPQAFQDRYHSLTIKLYGGGAKSRPKSKGVLQYIKGDDSVVQLKLMGSSLGTHSGNTVDNAKSFIRYDDFDQPYVAWAMGAAAGHRYDVRDFTVVLKYTALLPAPVARTTSPHTRVDARSLVFR